MQYSSLNDSHGFDDVDWLERLGVARSQREVTHLALNAAWIATATAGGYTLLQNLIEHTVMKLLALPRGE